MDTKERKKKNSRIIRKRNSSLNFIKKGKDGFQRIQINSIKNEAFSGVRLNLKSTIIKTKLEELTIDEPCKKIKYNFNIFEIIFSNFCSSCLSKNLKLKKNLKIKANNLLTKKLDIVYYSRNMILLDIFYKALLADNKKEILNILSRPVLCSKRKEEDEYDIYYNNYNEENFNNFNDEISDLVSKSGKQNIEKKLIFFSNKKLKELI